MSGKLNKMIDLKKQKESLLKNGENSKKHQIINHPVAQKNLELKIHYLNGIALMMNVDEEISYVEKEYFMSLIKAFGFNNSVIEDFIDFAQNPENEQIFELLEVLKENRYVKFSFIFDNLIIANKDGNLANEEKEMIELFFEMLEFNQEEIDEIYATFKEIQLPLNYKKTYSNFSITKNMVFIKGGTFLMGSNRNSEIESPIHEVTLNSFFLGKYQVTQKEWEKVVGNNPSKFLESDSPIETITWYDAVKFCNKISIKEGLQPCYCVNGDNNSKNWGDRFIPEVNWKADGYRLPTEAEWEYAAKGGNLPNDLARRNGKKTYYKYSGSNNIDEVAWYNNNSDRKPHSVGKKNPNELGIYDLSGNVFEWCWDCYNEHDINFKTQTNPHGADTGNYRMFRGGCWRLESDDCLVSNRIFIWPSESNSSISLRLLRSLNI